MPLVDSFYKGEINYFLNTHEQSGGHAATGYAKSSGEPGISIVTSGPGITNSLTPLTDATNDSTPLIVFSGCNYLLTLVDRIETRMSDR